MSNNIKLAIALYITDLAIYMSSGKFELSDSMMAMYLGFTLAAMILIGTNLVLKDNKQLSYGMVGFTALFIIANIVTSAMGLTNGYAIVDNVMGTTLFIAYILCVYKPVLAIGLMNISWIVVLIKDIIGQTDISNIITDEYIGITIIKVLALICYGYLVFISNKNKGKSGKDLIVSTILYERKPVKIAVWVHIMIWSIALMSIAYISNSEIIREHTNNDTRFMLYAALAYVIPYVLDLAALTASVLMIEFFGLYTVASVITIMILWIEHQLTYNNIASILVNVALFAYMIIQYRKLKTKEGDIIEVKKA